MKKSRIKKLLVAVAIATATNVSFAQTPYDSFAPSNEKKVMLKLQSVTFRAINEDTTSAVRAIELDKETLILSYLGDNDTILANTQLNPTDLKWWSVDPKAKDAPGWSPYRAFFNNPIRYIDPDGRWEKDANGNLVAEKGDNAWTFAKYLNTSADRAITMLGEQGYNVNKKGILQLNVGDVFNVENTSQTPENRADFGYIGNNIRDRAGSEFSKNMFENYWNGGGDAELSSQRFAGILIYVKENSPKTSGKTQVKLTTSKGTSLSGYKQAVSFYSSNEYNKVFGTSTLYYNKKNQVVGFYDFYDFDAKDWGKRSTKNEIITRAVNLFSPSTAQPFKINYGFSNR